jgi:hypothetical protein
MRSLGPWVTVWHRRLAVVGLVPLGLWLISGLAMPFVQYPGTDPARSTRGLLPIGRLASLPPVDCSETLEIERLPDGQFLRRCGQSPAQGVSGAALDERSIHALAQAHIEAIIPGAGAPDTVVLLAEPDLWTLPSRYLVDFPMLKARWNRLEETDVYVSLRTGRVVQETNRSSRLMAWLGPVPHWLYITALRRHRDPWRWVVMLTAVIAMMPLLTGLWNGWRIILRSRHRRGWSPYRRLSWRWHHLLGSTIGVTALVWTLSGFLSVNPWHWSTGLSPTEKDIRAWRGTDTDNVAHAVRDYCPDMSVVRRLQIDRVGKHVVTRCLTHSGESKAVDGHAGEFISAATVRAAVDRVLLARGIGSVTQTAPQPLPDDDAYLVMPPDEVVDVVHAGHLRIAYGRHSGRLLQVASTTGRWERWLYQGLHCWDMSALVKRPQLRRSLQVTMLLLGCVLVCSGALLAIRRWIR